MKLTSVEITKLLDILIGETTAVGYQSIDEIIEKNLKTLIDVTNWCLDGVRDSTITRRRHEYSMRKIGERAFSCLYEWHEWLGGILDSDSGLEGE